MEKLQSVKTIPIEKASKIIHKNPNFLRVGLRLNRFNFGYAVPPKKEGGRWNYIIFEEKFFKSIGLKIA